MIDNLVSNPLDHDTYNIYIHVQYNWTQTVVINSNRSQLVFYRNVRLIGSLKDRVTTCTFTVHEECTYMYSI